MGWPGKWSDPYLLIRQEAVAVPNMWVATIHSNAIQNIEKQKSRIDPIRLFCSSIQRSIELRAFVLHTH